MANAIVNLIQASKSLVNAASSTVNVSCQVVADGAELLNKSIHHAPGVIKATVELPMAAAKGYIMEAEGASAEEAEERAYKYVRQELSRTIQEAGEGSGKLLADLFKDEPVQS